MLPSGLGFNCSSRSRIFVPGPATNGTGLYFIIYIIFLNDVFRSNFRFFPPSSFFRNVARAIIIIYICHDRSALCSKKKNYDAVALHHAESTEEIWFPLLYNVMCIPNIVDMLKVRLGNMHTISKNVNITYYKNVKYFLKKTTKMWSFKIYMK